MSNETEKPRTNGSSNGIHVPTPPTSDAGAGAGSPLAPPPPPTQIAELVAACLRYVASKYGVALDGTPDTLGILDQYLRDARGEITARPESIDLLQATAGAYLGEVLRHRFGGEWLAEGEPDTWRLCFAHVYLSFNPLGMVREALTLTEEEGWGAHLEMDAAEREPVLERLRALGEVDEEEYFLPTSRYDVVEVAVEALQAAMRHRGLGDVVFSADDYGNRRR